MITIFTPSHNSKWLPDLYKCLKNQTYQDWEWIVVLNGTNYQNDDKRVKIVNHSDKPIGSVGALKKLACSMASGDYLAEVDHDDLITPDCLGKVVKVFENDPFVGFVYSNTANVEVKEDGNWKPVTWDTRYGWSYRNINVFGRDVVEAISSPPDPQAISRIWFAPNHIRVWRKIAYDEIGGHNEKMKISDDHDLICRTYLSRWKIYHIDECLYVYRVHGDNTWLQNAEEIQITMWQNYDKYIFSMMKKWSRENGLQCIDICSGDNPADGCITVDKEGGNIKADLDGKFPFANNSVGVVVARDAIEHLKNPINTMNEIHRILAHGGVAFIEVPSTDGRGAFQDPTHVSFWNENSFWYYTKEYLQRYIKHSCNVRFQTMKLITYFPSDWHKQNNISYVQAHLVALKNKNRFYGDLEI